MWDDRETIAGQSIHFGLTSAAVRTPDLPLNTVAFPKPGEQCACALLTAGCTACMLLLVSSTRATSSGTFSYPKNDTCCWTPSS
jgi:hypothetical protein